MGDYLAPGWQELFAHNGLNGFEDWWRLQAEWFEEPNRRRGGWSGVARVELALPDGASRAVFLKRQENHVRRTWRHPLRGEATFLGEMRNLQALARSGVATLDPLYFAWRRQGGSERAILVTLELSGYLPLRELADGWWDAGWAGYRVQRRQLIEGVARLLRAMHQGRRVHNSLYPKHLFVEPASLDVRVIDLEKMRRSPSSRRAALRDLDSLNRRSPHWSRSDRLRFLLAYLGEDRLSPDGRRLWRRLARKWRPLAT